MPQARQIAIASSGEETDEIIISFKMSHIYVSVEKNTIVYNIKASSIYVGPVPQVHSQHRKWTMEVGVQHI